MREKFYSVEVESRQNTHSFFGFKIYTDRTMEYEAKNDIGLMSLIPKLLIKLYRRKIVEYKLFSFHLGGDEN